MRYIILPGCRFSFRVGVPVLLFFEREKPSRACGNVGKSSRFLARLFQAAVGIRAFCGFPRTRHFHQAKPCSFLPTDTAEDPKTNDRAGGSVHLD